MDGLGTFLGASQFQFYTLLTNHKLIPAYIGQERTVSNPNNAVGVIVYSIDGMSYLFPIVANTINYNFSEAKINITVSATFVKSNYTSYGYPMYAIYIIT